MLVVGCWFAVGDEECSSTVENESRTTTFGDRVRSGASESRLVAAQSAVQAENHSGIAKVMVTVRRDTPQHATEKDEMTVVVVEEEKEESAAAAAIRPIASRRQRKNDTGLAI